MSPRKFKSLLAYGIVNFSAYDRLLLRIGHLVAKAIPPPHPNNKVRGPAPRPVLSVWISTETKDSPLCDKMAGDRDRHNVGQGTELCLFSPI
jgi:hypothetical protein